MISYQLIDNFPFLSIPNSKLPSFEINKEVEFQQHHLFLVSTKLSFRPFSQTGVSTVNDGFWFIN